MDAFVLQFLVEFLEMGHGADARAAPTGPTFHHGDLVLGPGGGAFAAQEVRGQGLDGQGFGMERGGKAKRGEGGGKAHGGSSLGQAQAASCAAIRRFKRRRSWRWKPNAMSTDKTSEIGAAHHTPRCGSITRGNRSISGTNRKH